MTVVISIIICCYNSSSKIKKTLEGLSLQTYSGNWEIVLVNNNSTDDTIDISSAYWHSQESNIPIRIIHETKLGLTFARKAGVKAAKGKYLIFCDDDNILASNYASNVVGIFESKPEVAAIGGIGMLPDNFTAKDMELAERRLAVGSENKYEGYVETVYGAGMALRKQIADLVFSEKIKYLLTDRKGNALSSGGDTEMCYLITKCFNQKVYLSYQLQFIHCIDQSRLSKKYLDRLSYAIGNSTCVLKLYNWHKLNTICLFQKYCKYLLTSIAGLLKSSKLDKQYHKGKIVGIIGVLAKLKCYHKKVKNNYTIIENSISEYFYSH